MSRSELPNEARSDPEATTATATSAVLTEPMANRGGSPRCRRNGVTTGPHAPIRPLVTPPAPAATAVPWLFHSGMGSDWCWASSSIAVAAVTGSGRLNRTRMRRATRKSSAARIGRI